MAGAAATQGSMAKAPPDVDGIQPAGTATRRSSAQASTNIVSRRGWRVIVAAIGATALMRHRRPREMLVLVGWQGDAAGDGGGAEQEAGEAGNDSRDRDRRANQHQAYIEPGRKCCSGDVKLGSHED